MTALWHQSSQPPIYIWIAPWENVPSTQRRCKIILHIRVVRSESSLSASLRKHVYSNILNIFTTQKWNITDKKSDISLTSGQNIDCGKTCLFKKTEKFTTKKFSGKNSDIHISAQNINCGYSLEPSRRGGSNVYPQSMFLGRNKKNNV